MMLKHIPNILSTLRIGMVPLFAYVYFSDLPNAHYMALGIFILAGITDVLDGFLARHYNLITKIGTVLDPLADKLMQLMAITCLAIDEAIPVWLTLIVVFKELSMIITGIYMYFRKESTVMASNYFGKAATVLFSFAIFITILYPNSLASILLIGSAILLKLTALISYIRHYFMDVKPNLGKNKV
ncbi:MAG: CDP-alcohol phosphatidyltransferase family protein [Vallitaleaceae bacterium]|nr:CDP-alcohol phosphatidyltransferase family protein [Vallitaleaceae bacterium]